MVAARRDGTDLVLEVRVQPRAAHSEFAGPFGDRLRIRLQAPPVDGRANAALIGFLADAFDVPRARISIEHGLSGRDKRVRIRDPGPVPPALRALVGCD
jgi:uncharacterized protein